MPVLSNRAGKPRVLVADECDDGGPNHSPVVGSVHAVLGKSVGQM